MAPSAVFSAFSAAAVVFSTTLISLCSQFGSHGRRERGEPLMGPSQRAEAGRGAETDNWNHRRRARLNVLLLFIALTFGCDETPQRFGSITHARLELWMLRALSAGGLKSNRSKRFLKYSSRS